mmetsp:Transcript_41939/g.75573  ORF Transcript_41939/g.75573 Transcript_41939/m.75573 type:complete len:275 (+) Transcript_41939:78-902(+)|eukprot:CAMPEP_0201913872 /NCGR_PEP_ID=MMETSP0903-20130614/4208_1 /ASSEMBLY_ACC=CAM_ASM_000552 /TAXON_ID=420261 /ORGANISM="Thalassiosira antarctica, Strain CCMP982" /LENGTH=274 /DNA_ID=CAMNT_0048449151 /DNA_START=51 /DNA_END=878 /DNA_ORIENTATION=+
MQYQSNNRSVEESYDSSTITGRLLPDSGINVGASNSARGDGTTAAELVTKFRLLNCGACLFIILFHTLPIIFNPIRLTLLISSPVRLILELIVGILASFLFLVEARIPILGEKVLILMRKFAVGRNQYIDLDVARGRALILMIMGGSLGLINYLAHNGVSSSKSGGGASDEISIPSSNVTDSANDDASANNRDASVSTLFIILQCTVFSPTTLIVFILSAYTLYVLNSFPEYAESRAYSIQDGSDTAAASTGPSWVSNVGDSVQGNGSYQTVGA